MILKATTPSNSPWLIPFTTLQFYGKKLDYLHLKNFLHSECELYLKQPLTLPQRKIIAAYHSLNHRLAIEIGRWTVILISRGTRLCHFYCYNTVKMKHISCWRVCPLYNHPIRDTFPSTFENVVPRNLKSGLSFNQTNKFYISLFLRNATTLRHSRESISWKASRYHLFQSHYPLGVHC